MLPLDDYHLIGAPEVSLRASIGAGHHLVVGLRPYEEQADHDHQYA